MADEVIKAPVQAKSKSWRYVGPGSTGHKDKVVPNITNLPLDLGAPRNGFRSGGFHADELPDEYIQYVMDTNTATKGWWVFE